ncbi:MAG: hypothetical protein LBG81_06345 [Coriobacteriaceae bacterium]|nr:hypothetical protein [Coriobacteriaceae bacterium]
MNASRSLSQSALETPRGKHARVEMVPVSPALGGQALRTRSAAQGPLRERARFTGEETWQKVGKHARMPLDDKAMAAMAEPAGQTAHRRGALPLPKPVPLPGANEGASEAKAGLPFANGGFPAARVSPPNANGALPVANGDLPAANGTSHHDDQVYSDPGTTIYSDPGATGAIMARAKHL